LPIGSAIGPIWGASRSHTKTYSKPPQNGSVSAAGLPDFLPPFILKWVQGMAAGEWQDSPKDLERLIGRKPTAAADYFRESYPAPAQAQEPTREPV
jgi:hypothetical protein